MTVDTTVAPLVGAWIEIYYEEVNKRTDMVAPLVGAWIEIMLNSLTNKEHTSLLSWERGLKSLETFY